MNWDTSHTFRRLLLTQVALTLIYPLLGDMWAINFTLGMFLMLALYGGISVTLAKPFTLWVSLILAILFIGSYWIAVATGINSFRIWSAVFGTAFFGFIASIMISHIFFFRSKVDVDLIYGAVSVYLLIGSAFTELYLVFALLNPDAFTGFDATADIGTVARSLSFFSFVTLTTLGYGDITPVAHYARVLAYSEAIIGQLYLTILVARLVGTYIAQSRSE
ncbi:MAG: ion channel [Arenicellales bacterium]|nr:ion channel [Arenicellales bacterium]